MSFGPMGSVPFAALDVPAVTEAVALGRGGVSGGAGGGRSHASAWAYPVPPRRRRRAPPAVPPDEADDLTDDELLLVAAAVAILEREGY